MATLSPFSAKSQPEATHVASLTNQISSFPNTDGGITLSPVTSNGSSSNLEIVTLDVSGTNISIPRILLEKSPVLKSSLPLHMEDIFCLGMDPDLLNPIVEYLRTYFFPLFWTQGDGFDLATYHRLQQEAKFLQLHSLHDWIQDQQYLKAVQVITEETIKEVHRGINIVSEYPGNVEIQQHLRTTMKHFFVCPRNKPEHRTLKGKPLVCGKECRKALSNGNAQAHYEQVAVTEMVTVKKTYVFHPEVLVRAKGCNEGLESKGVN